MKCMNIFKKPSLFTQSREESRGPLCWWNQKLLCQAPFFATPSTLIPYQSAPAPLPLHALQKWGKGTNIYKTLQHAGSLPGDFLFVVLLNSQSKHNSALCSWENEAQWGQSWVPFSSLCPQASSVQSREAISYPADSWLSASSPDFHLLKHLDIFLSVSSLISQQHLSGLTRPPPWLPWPHAAPLLPTSVWSFVGSSLSVGIPSTQLPFSYPAVLSQWIRSTLLALKAVCMLMTCQFWTLALIFPWTSVSYPWLPAWPLHPSSRYLRLS